MKVKLTIEMELPEIGLTDPELQQILYDAVINYNTVSHLQNALNACATGKIGTPLENASWKHIMEYHQNWAEIMEKATWSFQK